jgi:hypothetical protein
MPKYIAYILNLNEEYVVGVNPWVTYDSRDKATIVVTNMILKTHSLAFRTYHRHKDTVGEHCAIFYAGNITGYIARVE